MYLDYFIAYGSQLAEIVCFACVGLACWRLSKILHERSFALAALAMGLFVVLEMIYMMAYLLPWLSAPIIWQWWYAISTDVYHLASLFLFVFFSLFAVGAIRRGLRAKKSRA